MGWGSRACWQVRTWRSEAAISAAFDGILVSMKRVFVAILAFSIGFVSLSIGQCENRCAPLFPFQCRQVFGADSRTISETGEKSAESCHSRGASAPSRTSHPSTCTHFIHGSLAGPVSKILSLSVRSMSWEGLSLPTGNTIVQQCRTLTDVNGHSPPGTSRVPEIPFLLSLRI